MKGRFRVWDKTSKTMYHAGFLLTQDGRLVYLAFPEDSVPDGICEVMFSTGIKDKDDREIWEGDIVEMASYFGVEYVEATQYTEWFGNGDIGITLKVLGNKWEHPGLIV